MQNTWKIGLAVAAGGAVGALSRYAFGLLTDSATLLVNIIGSLILGLLTGFSAKREVKDWLKAGIGTGFCGGLTTMSTFSKEVFQLFEKGNVFGGISYIFVSFIGSLLCCYIGILIGMRKAGTS